MIQSFLINSTKELMVVFFVLFYVFWGFSVITMDLVHERTFINSKKCDRLE